MVRTAQPLGALAVDLLEPLSSDGLATWNFFDDELKVGDDFPVLRLPTATSIHTDFAVEKFFVEATNVAGQAQIIEIGCTPSRREQIIQYQLRI